MKALCGTCRFDPFLTTVSLKGTSVLYFHLEMDSISPPPPHCFLILVCEDSAEYKEIGVNDESGSSIQNGKFETVDVII